jgi:uncharacterized protein YegL
MFVAQSDASAQPQLNFKRIVNNWPTIEVYFSVGCNGQPAYFTDKRYFKVVENGIEIGEFELWCPDPTMRCAISVALVFDASGSMMGSGTAGAKAAGNAFVDMMDGVVDEAAVIWYNDSVRTRQGMTTSLDLLHSAINTLPASGGTVLWDGILSGVLELINNGVNQCRAVVAMTDGQDNASSHQPADIVAVANRNRVRVFTVSLGNAADSLALQEISNQTGGRYFGTMNPNVMVDIYQTISTIIFQGFQECLITYTAKCMDGSTRPVDLTLQNFCGGSDTKTKTYTALRDTSTFIPLKFRIGTTETRGNANVTVPLELLDPIMPKDIFYPATFTILFDENCAEFVDITAPPGSLLHGLSFSTTRIAGGVIIQSLGRTIVSAEKVPDTLASLVFHAHQPGGRDTICCDLQLENWTFAAGCFKPVLSDGALCISPAGPSISCQFTSFAPVQWAKPLQKYLPDSLILTLDLTNDGGVDAVNARITLDIDSTDITLCDPASATQTPFPANVVAGTPSRASWAVRPVCRSIGDSVAVCFTASFDNHPTIQCCAALWIPAAIPAVTLHGTDVICEGDSSMLSAAAGFARYLWSNGATQRTIAAKQAGQYWYSAIDAAGTTIASDTVALAVLPAPRPVVTPSGRVEVCEGTSVLLTALGSWRSIRWSNGDTVKTIRVWNAGAYSVTVTDDNGCAGSSDEVSVAIVSGQPVPISGNATACVQSVSTYYSSPIPGTLRLWAVTGGLISGSAQRDSVVVVWLDPGQQHVRVMVQDSASGCISRDTIAVTVLPLPTPRVAVDGPTVLCDGDSVMLDAGAAYRSFRWSDGRTSRRIAAKTTGEYHVLVEDNTGCLGRSDTITVGVYPRPAPRISGPSTVCPGIDALYSVANIPGHNYSWTAIGGVITTGTNDTIINVRWGSIGSGAVRVRESDMHCQDSVLIAVSIDTALNPNISVLGSPDICEGTSVTLDAGPGYAVYLWSNGLKTRTINVSQPGTYSVYVESAQGCTGNSDPVEIRVHPEPAQPVITRNGNLLTAPVGAWTYRWSRDGNDIPGEILNVLLATVSGIYRVTIVDSYGCSATSDPVDVVVTGMGSSPSAAALQPEIFPDPTSGGLVVRVPSSAGERVTITVVDMLGREVLDHRDDASSRLYQTALRIEPALPGTYFLFIRSGSHQWVRSVRVY